MSRPTVAKIDLHKLRTNYRSCHTFLGNDLQILAVVKADAYGHGAIECSRALEREGVSWFGVATPEEALILRDGGIKTRILCMGGFWPGQEKSLIERAITPAISDTSLLQPLENAAAESGNTFTVHIKVDTGMGRLGIRWDDARDFIDEFRKCPHLIIEGMMTHFASADDLSESEFTWLQTRRFHDVVSLFQSAGHSPTYKDLSNSPDAIVSGSNGGNMVRLGGILFGLGKDIVPDGIEQPELEPIMSITSEITHLKQLHVGESVGYGRTFVTERLSVIATVPIGYYDGYRRGFSNRAEMIVRGRRVPVIGRVSMDWTTIDVTDVPGVKIGDRVTVVGSDHNQTIVAEELAAIINTISYEITCGIGRRVPRLYL